MSAVADLLNTLLKTSRATIATFCGIVSIVAVAALVAPIESVQSLVSPHRGFLWVGLFFALAVLLVCALGWVATKIHEADAAEKKSADLRKHIEKMIFELSPQEKSVLRGFMSLRSRTLDLATHYPAVQTLFHRHIISLVGHPGTLYDIQAAFKVADEEVWAYLLELEERFRAEEAATGTNRNTYRL